MNVYYDSKKRCWSIVNKEDRTIGSNKIKLAAIKTVENHHYPFPIVETEKNAGPIVGILTSYNNKKKLVGNGPLFIRLQTELRALGGIIVVFAPEDVEENGISGFAYVHDENRWIYVKSPLPHIVYNRIPFRKTEKDSSFHRAIAIFSNNSIPYFNPSFINKFDLYQVLKMDKVLKKFLPETILITQKKELGTFLLKHKNIYIKAVQGYKGKNIFNIYFNEDSSIICNSSFTTSTFPSFDSFWQSFEQSQKNTIFIAQQTIDAALFHDHRYDFRILITYNHDKYTLTGVGIRQSVSQEITTHIPNGGQLLSYDLVQTAEHDDFIHLLVENCGPVLSEHFGFFGEFSIDACVDKDGNYYIFEINSKPMLFDEEEIETKRCRQLINLFYQLSHTMIKD
ncbi:YheC/YheD family endospore coat-associated protein [Niallia sp. 01092]|uniref:YheC/YheD family endospore coat-associated protein n=1 Tax=unclassified Niallia TaxID=2837522 RepID=UPI003FCFF7F8